VHKTADPLRGWVVVASQPHVLAILVSTMLGCAMQLQQSIFTAAPRSPFPVGSQPADVVVGDVNGDGHLDTLIANTGTSDVTVLLGDGAGGLRPTYGSPFPAGMASHLLVVGDLNTDGKPDLALTAHDSNGVTVLLGDGQGGFSPAVGSPFEALQAVNAHNHGLLLGDANGDGALDIITANQDDNSVSLLLGDGRGDFRPADGSPFAVGLRPYPPAVGDTDQDGNLDIVIPNFGSNDVTVLLGNGKGGFAAARGSPHPVERAPYFAALGDVNGDASLDVLVTHDDSSLLTILFGDGRGSFKKAPGAPVDAGRRGWKVLLGDMNGDGAMDLITSTVGDSVVVLLGDGGGAFEPAIGSPFATGRGPWGVAVADLDRDGSPDIITANTDSNDLTVLLASHPRGR